MTKVCWHKTFFRNEYAYNEQNDAKTFENKLLVTKLEFNLFTSEWLLLMI